MYKNTEVRSPGSLNVNTATILSPYGSLTDIQCAQIVMNTNKINAVHARIPVRSNWNFELFESLCVTDRDYQVLTFLRYGWPIDRVNIPVCITMDNHSLPRCIPSRSLIILLRRYGRAQYWDHMQPHHLRYITLESHPCPRELKRHQQEKSYCGPQLAGGRRTRPRLVGQCRYIKGHIPGHTVQTNIPYH